MDGYLLNVSKSYRFLIRTIPAIFFDTYLSDSHLLYTMDTDEIRN